MSHADFVHLRVHDAFSLSEGAIKIPNLIDLCKRHHMPAVGVADTGNLFGALEFSMSARDSGVQPVIGCQIAIKRESDMPHGGGGAGVDGLVLLVQSEEGYRNLLALVSKSFLASAAEDAAQIAMEDLEGHNEGLIALTGGVSGTVGPGQSKTYR